MASKKNTIPSSHEKLDLHIGDRIFITNTWKEKVPATIVGFDTVNALAWIEDGSRGNPASNGYTDYIHSDYSQAKKKGKYWFISDNFEHETALGLKLGDEVYVGRTKSGYLIKDGTKEWDTTGKYPPVKAKVIGFERDGSGETYESGKAIRPLFAIDRNQFKVRNIRSSQANWNGEIEEDIAPRYEKRYGDFCDEEYGDPIYDNGFWYVDNERAFKRTLTTMDTKQGEKNMSNETERKPFVQMIKGDAMDAGYRIVGTQISKATKASVLALLTKQGGSSNAIKAVSEMLDTVYGESLISILIGLGIHYSPLEITQDPRLQRVGEEMRIQAMSGAGNEIMSTMMETLMPVIMGALASIPQETTVENKSRVVDHADEEIEEEFAAPAQKTMTANG